MKKQEITLSKIGMILLMTAGLAANNQNVMGQVISGSSLYSNGGGGVRILSGATSPSGGTASNPAIGFHSNPQSSPTATPANDGGGGNGIFRPAANEMGFTTGSVERIRITSGGSVGIGTSTPTSKLSVSGSEISLLNPSILVGSGSAMLKMGRSDAWYAGMKAYVANGQPGVDRVSLGFLTTTFNGTNVVTEQRMTINDVGFVGIGTLTPNAPLQLSNAVQNRKLVLYEGADNDHQFYGLGVNSSILRYQSVADHAFYAATSPTQSNEIMRIKGASGFVGIGNSSPSARLEITHGTNGNSGLRFTNLNSSSAMAAANGKALSVNTNGDVILVPAATGTGEWARTGSAVYPINTSDNIGIGTTSPIAKLQVNGKTYIGTGNWLLGSSLSIMPGNYKLYVENGILTEKVKVALRGSSNWADHVFADDYKLRSLDEVEDFINENNHLPGVPSATEIVNEGLDLGAMQAKQMEKIEELTLYMIQMKKEIEVLKSENASLKSSNIKN